MPLFRHSHSFLLGLMESNSNHQDQSAFGRDQHHVLRKPVHRKPVRHDSVPHTDPNSSPVLGADAAYNPFTDVPVTPPLRFGSVSRAGADTSGSLAGTVMEQERLTVPLRQQGTYGEQPEGQLDSTVPAAQAIPTRLHTSIARSHSIYLETNRDAHDTYMDEYVFFALCACLKCYSQTVKIVLNGLRRHARVWI